MIRFIQKTDNDLFWWRIIKVEEKFLFTQFLTELTVYAYLKRVWFHDTCDLTLILVENILKVFEICKIFWGYEIDKWEFSWFSVLDQSDSLQTMFSYNLISFHPSKTCLPHVIAWTHASACCLSATKQQVPNNLRKKRFSLDIPLRSM